MRRDEHFHPDYHHGMTTVASWRADEAPSSGGELLAPPPTGAASRTYGAGFDPPATVRSTPGTDVYPGALDPRWRWVEARSVPVLDSSTVYGGGAQESPPLEGRVATRRDIQLLMPCIDTTGKAALLAVTSATC